MASFIHTITVQKQDDRVQVEPLAGITAEGGAVVLQVHSASGIGSCDISRVAHEAWPAVIQLRLHLRGLEQLKLHAGAVQVMTGISSSSGGQQFASAREGDGVERALERGEAEWPHMNVMHGAEGHAAVFEVTVPQAMLRSNPPKLSVHWIDFFR